MATDDDKGVDRQPPDLMVASYLRALDTSPRPTAGPTQTTGPSGLHHPRA